LKVYPPTQSGQLPIVARILTGILRVFFKLLYHQLSWTYDLVAWIVSTGLWNRWVLLTLPYLKGPNILEVGHGPGHLQSALGKNGLRAIGLDESRQMGRLAYGRIVKRGYVPLLASGYAQFMPFPTAHFQQIAATFPSEYIRDPLTIQEIMRVLEPGGQLVILPLAWLTGRRLHARAAAWLSRTTNQAPEWDVRMVMPYEQAGFKVKVEFLTEGDSQAVIIIAQKPKSNHPII
jgi:ubiquinone/menaquinone biosynthesis C-methylase UbiE